MSCWVVAAVAAELWGIPVAQVMARVRCGDVPWKRELGFLLVDVAPNSPRLEAGQLIPGRKPSTFKIVEPEPEPALAPSHHDEQEPADPNPEPEPESRYAISDWRKIRRQMGQVRKPPRKAPLAA